MRKYVLVIRLVGGYYIEMDTLERLTRQREAKRQPVPEVERGEQPFYIPAMLWREYHRTHSRQTKLANAIVGWDNNQRDRYHQSDRR